MKNFFLALILILIGTSFIFAQAEMSPEPQKAEMKKMEALIGQWKGAGWSQQGREKLEFTGTETVQKKLDGLALLVEGKFVNDKDIVVHQTLAVLSFNRESKDYRFNTFLLNGASGEHKFKLIPDGYEWGFKIPSGTIRYTIKIKDNVWSEIGEYSKDETGWVKIFEMNLKKVG